MTHLLRLTTFSMILAAVFASSALQAEPKPRHAPETLPGVEPEMLTPDYWISRMDDPDKIVMTPAEITRFNERLRTKKVDLSPVYGKPHPLERQFAYNLAKGLIMNPLQPLDLPKELPGDSLKVWLDYNIGFLKSRDLYDDRNVIYNDAMQSEIIAKMNRDAVPDRITREYGIIVEHGNIRYFPTATPGYSDTQWELDFFQATGILIGDPVTVLHSSSDSDFLYVETPIARGWIDARSVARGTREDIAAIVNDPSFLIAACDKVPVYADPAFTRFSRHLYFAATMPLLEKTSEAFIVRMPYAGPDGSLAIMKGYIKPDALVHVGFYPYTKRNVITLLFRLLNRPYGWGDQDNKRSCAGTVRVLFRSFGFRTGRYPSFLLEASDKQTIIDPSWSVEKITNTVSEIEPFVTIAGTPDHVVLFIGKGHTGKLYYMHQAGWGYDENGEHLFVNRTTINAADHVFYDITKPLVYTTFR